MAVKFANRMNLLKGSEIRALLALTAKPEVISFAGGMPAPELFPTEGVKEAACKVMDNMGRVALQYTGTDGFASLREKIVARMAAKNDIHVSIDDILITSGSQQGLDFSARVFLNPGDVVLVESPSYLGAINAFKACEPTFVEVPTDDAGMIPEELDKILATTENVKMIYVIPDFQNPTGKTWTLERRQKFMELINKYEIPVIEDNPYGELRFEGEFLPSLKSMDTKDLVIFLGTMSKIFAPGLRIGWVCSTNAEVLGKYNFIKQGADLQSSTIDQLITNQFLEDNDLDAHVEKIKAVYSDVEYVSYIPAPYHLEITSYAHIGIVFYRNDALNKVFCAPNKIYEYSGFGIPMLANDIPGLKNTVGNAGAAECMELKANNIINAIQNIEADYDTYSENAKKFFAGTDNLKTMEKLMRKIVK